MNDSGIVVGSPEAAHVVGASQAALTNAVLHGALPAPAHYQPRTRRGGSVDHVIGWTPQDIAAVWALSQLDLLLSGGPNGRRFSARRRLIVAVWDTVHDWDLDRDVLLVVAGRRVELTHTTVLRHTLAQIRRGVVRVLPLNLILDRMTGAGVLASIDR